jgi:hypothetical protein
VKGPDSGESTQKPNTLLNMATNFRNQHASNSICNAANIYERICNIKESPFLPNTNTVYTKDNEVRIGAEIVTHFNYNYHINIEVSEFVLLFSLNVGKVDLNKIKAIGHPGDSLLHFCEKRNLSYELSPFEKYRMDLQEDVKYNITKILSHATPYDKFVTKVTYRIFLRESERAEFKSSAGRPRKTVRRKLMWSNIYDSALSCLLMEEPTVNLSLEYAPGQEGQGLLTRTPSPRRVHFESSVMEAQMGFLPSVADVFGGETLENINSLVEQLTHFMPDVKKSNDELLVVLEKVKDMISVENASVVKEYIKQNIENFQVNNDLRTISDDTLKGLSLATFASASLYAYYARTHGSYAVLAASTVGVVYFYKDKLSEILPLIANVKFLTEEPEINMMEAQVDINSGDFITLIATTLMGMSIKGSNASNLPQNVLKHIGDFSRIRTNLESIGVFVIELIGKILDAVNCPDILPSNIRNFHILDKDIMWIIDAMAVIKQKQMNRTFNFTDDNYDMILGLIDKCAKILVLHKGKDRTHAHITVANHMQMLEKLAQQFRDVNYRVDGLRMEPVSFLLAGGPGTLKSSAMYHLAESILPFLLTQDQKDSCKGSLRDKYTYNRTPEGEFWDDFTSEKVVCMFDDYGQVRDVAGSGDGEHFNIIRAVNEFQFNPHMADLGSKGNVKFRCKAVLATSNATDWHIESIIQPEAVFRRFDKTYIVVPKPEFELDQGPTCSMLKKVDFAKLPKGPLDISSVSPEVLHFVEYDLIKRCETGIVKSFDEIVDIFHDIYQVKVLRFEQKREELKRRAAFYDTKYKQDSIVFVDPLEKKDSGVCMEAQVGGGCNIADALSAQLGFNINDFEDIEPERVSTSVARERKEMDIPSIIRLDDPVGLLVRSYIIHAYNCRKYGTSTHIEKFFKLMNAINNPISGRSYHDAIVLYAMVKVYGKDIIRALQGSVSLHDIILEYPVTYEDISVNSPQIYLEISTTDKIMQCYQSVRDKIIEMYNTPVRVHLQKMTAFCKENWKMISGVLMIAGCIYKCIWKGSTKDIDLSLDRDSQYGYALRKGGNRSLKEIAKKAGKPPVESQFNWGQDTNGERAVEKVIKKNVYGITYVNKETGVKQNLGYVTFIIHSFALVPAHFIKFLDLKRDDGEASYDDTIELSRYNGGVLHRLFVTTVREFLAETVSNTGMDCNDICLIKFPEDFGPHRNIIHLFPYQHQVEQMKDMKGKLYVPDKDWQQSKNVSVKKMCNQKVHMDQITVYNILNGYEYDAHTQRGDCGAILAILNSRIKDAKIFGIHTAGQTANSVGFASAVTRDMIEEVLQPYMKDLIDEPLEVEAQSGAIIADGRFTELYDVPKPIHSTGETAIIKSVLHSCWKPSSLAPAKLRPFYVDEQRIVPMDNALLKYCSSAVLMPTKVLDDIKDDIFDFLEYVSTEKVDRRLFTYEEAIKGLDGEVMFGSISRKTSPGYPWILDRPGTSGKFYLFGTEQEYSLDSAYALILKKSVDDIIANAVIGKRTRFIFTDNLKDETRPIEKVIAGKTRLFSGCPIDYLVTFRMYFGAFSLWFMKNRIVNHSAIGVNPYSTEWNRIASYLLEKGDKNDACIGAGDYGAFDGSEKGHIHWLIFNIVIRWYNDGAENARIRRVLWCDLTQSKHLNGKTVYQWNASLPSGHPWTIIVNGLYNEVAFRYCWAKTVSFDRILMHDFDKHVYVIFMGDDNAFSVSPEWRENFNEMTLAQDMKDLGLSYTTEHKGEALVPLRKIGEIDFLKRSFTFSDSMLRYIAPLQLDVVLEIPFWTRKHDSKTITEDNCETTIKELSLHGKEVFYKYVPLIAEAMKEHLGHGPILSSYSLALATVLDSEFMY